MALMPVCKLPGPEVLPLSYSSMLHAYSMAIYILTELIAVWGDDAGGSPLNACCQLPPDLITELPPGPMLPEDSMVQPIRGTICMIKCLLEIFLILYFCPRPQRYSEPDDRKEINAKSACKGNRQAG